MGRTGTDFFQFDYQPTSRVHFGAKSLAQIGEIANRLKAQRVFLLSDQAIATAGYVNIACDALKASGCEVRTYLDVVADPSSEDVMVAANAAREWGEVDCLVGLGGGSVLDTAKGVNFLLSFGGVMEDYWGSQKGKGAMLASIGIPTTAGTGSESQSYALIKQGGGGHRKMACGDVAARFREVILDPELLVSVPRKAACHAAVDAMTHAIEAFVSTARSPISCMFAKEAFVLLNNHFERVLANASDVEAWGQMLLGSHLAGLAIENSMLGAAHACGNVLTYSKAMPHGEAVGVMLPYVMRYNAAYAEEAYGELARAIRLNGDAATATQLLIGRVEYLFGLAGIPVDLQSLRLLDFNPGDMAEQALKEWTGTFNPRPMGAADFEKVFESAYDLSRSS